MPPADVRAKAFEPFFTTKHRGTGLGLAIARRAITGHRGQIRIDTPPAGGTASRACLIGHRRTSTVSDRFRSSASTAAY